MIATTDQLNLLLMQERVKYLESVVSILQPELEARLSSSIVLEHPAPAHPVADVEQVEAPPALRPQLLPSRSAPKPARREPVRRTSPRRERIVEVLSSTTRIVPGGELAREVYGEDSEAARTLVAQGIKTLRDEGKVETLRGRVGEHGTAALPVVIDVPQDDEPAATWSPVNGWCWHIAGPCDDYARGDFCGHCTDQDGGVICPKKHRQEQPHERVLP